jgi:hypothetical protein
LSNSFDEKTLTSAVLATHELMLEKLVLNKDNIKRLEDETTLSIKELQETVDIAVQGVKDNEAAVQQYQKKLACQYAEDREEFQAEWSPQQYNESQYSHRVVEAYPATGGGQQGGKVAKHCTRPQRKRLADRGTRDVHGNARSSAEWNDSCTNPLRLCLSDRLVHES